MILRAAVWVLLSLTGVVSQCPLGWTDLGLPGRCFTLTVDQQSWDTAARTCEHLSGTLAEFPDEIESLPSVVRYLRVPFQIWVGGSRDAHGMYRWLCRQHIANGQIGSEDGPRCLALDQTYENSLVGLPCDMNLTSLCQTNVTAETEQTESGRAIDRQETTVYILTGAVVVLMTALASVVGALFYKTIKRDRVKRVNNSYEYIDDFVLREPLSTVSSKKRMEILETSARSGNTPPTTISGIADRNRVESNVYDIVKTFTATTHKEEAANASTSTDKTWTPFVYTAELGKLWMRNETVVAAEVHDVDMKNSNFDLVMPSQNIETEVEVVTEDATVDKHPSERIVYISNEPFKMETGKFPSRKEEKCEDSRIDKNHGIHKQVTCLKGNQTESRLFENRQNAEDIGRFAFDMFNNIAKSKNPLVMYNKAYQPSLNDYERFDTIVSQTKADESFYITPV